ncbi:SGNH/GDSL hydrolase family protein [Mucilaginibacter polytrichastri]|uniref:Uncharacterized protein n=2 Tax=Mucilaginibacter polytrichastri TaxID=1302689 RepID=A0A1Q5ZSU0_9SPHI|nr:SGNH/GDSL hydrolase family protein [Mucilaginibacter polytrichastri]OKS84839.1 hypothetical protein RG47T_0276 [Mucilaginibacter polytrichastri]SFS48789.1 hypothetical protein SAMN04487890_101798 [Mucilaginibacter polytrichastri]
MPVNDIGATDTVAYNTTKFNTQLRAVIAQAISKGWPASNIFLFNPSYQASPAYPQYRHDAYAAVMASVASDYGVLYYDAWYDFKAAYASNSALLLSDLLHIGIDGNAYVATLLTNYLTGKITNTASLLRVNSAKTYGASRSYNSLYANNFYSPNVQSLDIQSSNKITSTRIGGIGINVLGASNYLAFGGSTTLSSSGKPQAIANTRKIGNITGWSYFSSENNSSTASGTMPLISYDATNTTTAAVYYAKGGTSLYSVTDHYFYTTPTPGVTGNPNLAFHIRPDGMSQFGNNFNNTVSMQALMGTYGNLPVGTGYYGIRNHPVLTPTANNQALISAIFETQTSAGTGLLTATVSTNTTTAADGTYSSQTVISTTGIGSGSTVTVVVTGGIAAIPTQVVGGINYAIGDQFTLTNIPGAVFQVASLGYTGVNNLAASFPGGPVLFPSITAPTSLVSGMFGKHHRTFLRGQIAELLII